MEPYAAAIFPGGGFERMNYVFAVTIAAMSSVVCFKFTKTLLGALLLGGEIHEPEVTKVLEGDEDNDNSRAVEND